MSQGYGAGIKVKEPALFFSILRKTQSHQNDYSLWSPHRSQEGTARISDWICLSKQDTCCPVHWPWVYTMMRWYLTDTISDHLAQPVAQHVHHTCHPVRASGSAIPVASRALNLAEINSGYRWFCSSSLCSKLAEQNQAPPKNTPAPSPKICQLQEGMGSVEGVS